MNLPAKLALCVTPDDYSVFAGPDWPNYADYLKGEWGNKTDICKEIQGFTDKFLEQGTKFPIRTATACQSKWTWSTIFLNTLSTASCHRVEPFKFTLDDFDNFHNTPEKITAREKMLKGEWPGLGCEYCKNIESAGGHSDRLHNLEIRGLTPPEVELDPTVTHVSPKIVEIFAQNTCNLACVYCSSTASSKIEQENVKHGPFNKNGVRIQVERPSILAPKYFDRWIAWLDKNIQSLVRLHLLGGETFIQHELMTRVLDIIEKRPSPNLEFCIFSNLNVPDKYWTMYIERIRKLQQQGHIQVFDLTASIDCWGPEQEYVRSGLNLDRFEQRFAWASEQGAWMRLNANQTVTAQTVRTMPELIKKIDQYSQHKNIGHYFQFYTGPQTQMFQHPQTFAWSMWANDFDRIFTAMPQRTLEQHEAILRMQGLQAQLQQQKQHNWTDIRRLHTYLDEIDRRRGTNWRSLFSYLDIHE